MARLLQFLSSETGRPVADRTGLTAPMFELRWLPTLAEPQSGSPPVLVTAIQEQLGLKLDPQRGPVEIVIVSSVEPPTENQARGYEGLWRAMANASAIFTASADVSAYAVFDITATTIPRSGKIINVMTVPPSDSPS